MQIDGSPPGHEGGDTSRGMRRLMGIEEAAGADRRIACWTSRKRHEQEQEPPPGLRGGDRRPSICHPLPPEEAPAASACVARCRWRRRLEQVRVSPHADAGGDTRKSVEPAGPALPTRRQPRHHRPHVEAALRNLCERRGDRRADAHRRNASVRRPGRLENRGDHLGRHLALCRPPQRRRFAHELAACRESKATGTTCVSRNDRSASLSASAGATATHCSSPASADWCGMLTAPLRPAYATRRRTPASVSRRRMTEAACCDNCSVMQARSAASLSASCGDVASACRAMAPTRATRWRQSAAPLREAGDGLRLARRLRVRTRATVSAKVSPRCGLPCDMLEQPRRSGGRMERPVVQAGSLLTAPCSPRFRGPHKGSPPTASTSTGRTSEATN